MGATEEQMQLLSDANVTHVSYILILYSISFLLYLFVNVLLHIYATHTWGDDESNGRRTEATNALAAQKQGSRTTFAHSRATSVAPPLAASYYDAPSPDADTVMNGSASGPGNGKIRLPRPHRTTPSQQVRDAEEFELEGLMSDDEDETDMRKDLPKEHV